MISSFYPVIAGRVSNGLTRNRALYQIQSDQAALRYIDPAKRLEKAHSKGRRQQSVKWSPSVYETERTKLSLGTLRNESTS